MPQSWKQKVSVKYHWKEIIKLISSRFASELIKRFNYEYYFKRFIKDEDDLLISFNEGILNGLSTISNLEDSNIFLDLQK